MSELTALVSNVQMNCHISDALHARDYTLCIYLLKMREYYRWEKRYGFDDRLSQQEVGAWLTERERLWQTLEDAEFEPVTVGGRSYDPFDGPAINAQLGPMGLVYSGGIGAGAKPHFFLARLASQAERQGRTVLVAGEEYARDLTAPAGMILDGVVFVRTESVRRLVWEKAEEWSWHKNETAMSRAMGLFGFERDFDAALAAMTASETEAVILHELGELQVGDRFGRAWEEVLSGLARSRAEFGLRAVRDHLADCLSTLPALIEGEAFGSLHFYFANLQGMRRQLFPALVRAYEQWMQDPGSGALADAVERGRVHWGTVAEELMALAAGAPDPVVRQARLEERLEGVVL